METNKGNVIFDLRNFLCIALLIFAIAAFLLYTEQEHQMRLFKIRYTSEITNLRNLVKDLESRISNSENKIEDLESEIE